MAKVCLNPSPSLLTPLGMPTLFRVQAGENFLKGVPKDNFQKIFIISLKPKGGQRENFQSSALT
jgi:hypothetical protein